MTVSLLGKRTFPDSTPLIGEQRVLESINRRDDKRAAEQIKRIPNLRDGSKLFHKACQMGLTESAVALAERGYFKDHFLKSALPEGHIGLIRKVMRTSIVRPKKLLFLLPDYVSENDPWHLSSPIDLTKDERIRFHQAVDKAAREYVRQLEMPNQDLVQRWNELGHPSFEVKGSKQFKEIISSLTLRLLSTKMGFSLLHAIEKQEEKIYIHESEQSKVCDLHLYLNPMPFVEVFHLIDRKGEGISSSDIAVVFLHELSHILLRLLENDSLRSLNGIHPSMENLEEQLTIMHENFYRFETQKTPAYRYSHLGTESHDKNYLLADLLVSPYEGINFILLDRVKNGGVDIKAHFRNRNNLLHLLLEEARFPNFKLVDQIRNLIDRGVKADEANSEGITPLQMMEEKLTPEEFSCVKRHIHINDLFSFCQS